MKIIVSGGTGLVGRNLIPKLLERGHTIVNLTTRENVKNSGVAGLQHSYWNPVKGVVDNSIFSDADAVINLAGFSVANRWTQANKQLMISSRLQSTQLLSNTILGSSNSIKAFVTASASGYYGFGEQVFYETDKPGQGFLPELTSSWESGSVQLEASNIRRVVFRIGVVLAKEDGAVARMLPFFKAGLGAAVGSGKQKMSWIHIDDLSNAFIYALENESVKGVYNMSAPKAATNDEFSAALASAINRPFFMPRIPGFMLKLMFGEMATMLLGSQQMNSDKLTKAGFKFRFTDLKMALSNLPGN